MTKPEITEVPMSGVTSHGRLHAGPAERKPFESEIEKWWREGCAKPTDTKPCDHRAIKIRNTSKWHCVYCQMPMTVHAGSAVLDSATSEQVAQKQADPSGWIDCAGKPCPFQADVKIDFKRRNGEVHTDNAVPGRGDWGSFGPYGIVACRLHKTEPINYAELERLSYSPEPWTPKVGELCEFSDDGVIWMKREFFGHGTDAWPFRTRANSPDSGWLAWKLCCPLATKEPEWIEWKGGECPLKEGVRFEAKGESGIIYRNPKTLSWAHDNRCDHIIAYRVLS